MSLAQPEGSDELSVQAIQQLITRLSAQFGEAQAFATHRVVEYHHWMLAKDGTMLRSFAFLGEGGAVLADSGMPTDAEAAIEWLAQPREQWVPREADVMQVAGAWSIDPTLLDPAEASSGPGILGIAPGRQG